MARPTDKRWKGYLIDWPTIAAMDSEDYELKPLNQQQVAILLMLLEYQKWETRWTNLGLSKDELQAYIGDIEERLMRNEGGGMATKDDIRDGIYEAFNRLALQLASGGYTNIQVDEEGNVTSGTAEEQEGLPEDDPTTPIDETAAARGGGVVGVRLGMNTIWANLTAWYNAGVVLANTQNRLKQIYLLDDTGSDALAAQYYSDRQQSQPSVPATGFAATLEPYLYCKGNSVQSVGEWIYEVQTANIQNQSSFILAALTQAQLDYWFTEGAKVPSSLYLDYSCVPSPTEIMFIPTLGTAYTTQTSWKPLHVLEITVENYALDGTDGDIRDFWWYKTSAGTPVFQGTQTNIQLGTGITKPTTNQVPYTSTHKYVFTLQTPAASGNMQVTIPSTSMSNVTFPAGQIKMTIVDKGELVN